MTRNSSIISEIEAPLKKEALPLDHILFSSRKNLMIGEFQFDLDTISNYLPFKSMPAAFG